MIGFRKLFLGLASALSSPAYTSMVPEGCYRQQGHPIPTPEGRIIYTPAEVICPARGSSAPNEEPSGPEQPGGEQPK